VTPRRAVLVVLPAALVATVALRGEAGAADPAKCVRAARIDRGTCMRDAVERCKQNFETSLGTCFGSRDGCLRGCIAERDRCFGGPEAGQGEKCRLACVSDQKMVLSRCLGQVDPKDCQRTAKEQLRECTQHCKATAGVAKQRCGKAFDDCLDGCAG